MLVEGMGEDVHINRFALTAVLTAARAKRPSEYPDFETLNAMSDARRGSTRVWARRLPGEFDAVAEL